MSQIISIRRTKGKGMSDDEWEADVSEDTWFFYRRDKWY